MKKQGTEKLGKIKNWMWDNWLYISLIILFIISVLIQLFLGEFNFKEMLPDITLSLGELVLTAVILDILLKKSEKIKGKKFLKETIKNQFTSLVSNMINSFNMTITDEPYYGNIQPYERLCSIKRNPKKYMTYEKLLKHKRKVEIGANNEEFTYEEMYLKFKIKTQSEITMFLNRFVTMVPNDLIVLLCEISDLLNDLSLFTTIELFGREVSLTPTDVEEYTKSKSDQLLKIADKIEELHQYL